VVREQLLYEIDDPGAYRTPDAVADITQCSVEQAGIDQVRLTNVIGHEWPSHLKVLVCQDGGWLAEGEISYAGPRAEARARLAADILRHRLKDLPELRFDLIGVLSIHADDGGRRLARTAAGTARDVRLRVAGVHEERRVAELVGREVNALYTCGPAGGGGVRTSLRQRLETLACYVPRTHIPVSFKIVS